ncbi:hypothetical protein IJG93_01605 [Candidatus Saccharibacteria bacterium]|nr:hypothetical protein [Candidatus Saccharibacteria bacterium]
MPSEEQARSISTDYIYTFSPTLGGYYNNGSQYEQTTRGIWWNYTMYNSNISLRRDILIYDTGSGIFTNTGVRYYGFYIRCIQAS